MLGSALTIVGVSYVLTWVLYWPAFGPATGIQQPLHYNETYVWPMPWTLHQAAPGVSLPTPLTFHKGDAVSQSFRARADNLALVQVWLAGESGGEQVFATLSDERGSEALYAGSFRLEDGGVGKYYYLLFSPIADSAERKFVLKLKALDATVITRVGYLDRIPGQPRLNEFPLRGDLDVNVYHRGRPGLWTLKVVGERLLPELVRTRVKQYKPDAFKGGAFSALCAALMVGLGLLLWASCSPLHSRWHWALAMLAALGGALLAGAIVFRWDVAAMTAMGQRVQLSPGMPQVATAKDGRSTHDLLAGLEFAIRKPEPRQIQAQFMTSDDVQRTCIAVPATSEVTYGLRVPYDSELRLGLALPEGATKALTFRIHVEGDTLLEQTLAPADRAHWYDVAIDMRPYAGHLVRLALTTHFADAVPEFGGMPPGGALAVAGLWAGPHIVSERTWLLEYPLAEQPQYPQLARFGDEVELLGYDLDVSDVRPGGAVRATLYWRALRPVDTSYTVFIHLLDAANEIRGQKDNQPLDATYPTDVWPLNTVVRDEYVVPVRGDAPLDEYRIAVGLYELATMNRLPAYDITGEPWSDDQVLLEPHR